MENTKPYHLAKFIAADGNVSPLCAKKHRELNLKTERWTIRAKAVTCKKCLKLIPVYGLETLGAGIEKEQS